MGLSTLSYLKQLFPDIEVSYAVPAWIAPLFRNVQIAAERVVELDFKGIQSLKSFSTIWRGHYEHIFELHQTGRTAKWLSLLSHLQGCRYSYHNHNLSSGGKVQDQGVRKPSIQRDLDGVWSALRSSYACDLAIPNYLDLTPLMRPKTTIKKRKQIVLGIVATRSTKQWPIKYFHELARDLKDWEILVPVSSSAMDQKLWEDFCQLGALKHVRALELNLEQLPSVLASAHFYIGNDTGLKHICVALGLRTFTFFGPEEPLEWHPYDERVHPYYFLHPLGCRTVNSHFCALKTCESMQCLNQFNSKHLLERLKNVQGFDL